jgi:ACS family hexuronate transporter-like MFS transporter
MPPTLLATLGLAAVPVSVAGFMLARAVLAVGEPATSRPRSRPPPNTSRRRSARFATGIFNSGANIGAILAPLTVP